MVEIKIINNKEELIPFLSQIQFVLENAYVNSNMFKRLQEIHENNTFFKGFIAIENNNIIGYMELFQGEEYLKLKRVCVLQEFRGKGISSQLLNTVESYVFETLNINFFIGSSNEIQGIKFYLKHGALFSLQSIQNSSNRNSKENNLKFFLEFLRNKTFKEFRYPIGDGFKFMFTSENKKSIKFQEEDFIQINY